MDFFTMLNGNKIVWGVSMLILNMGSRYIIGDLGKTHEILMKNEFFKKIILIAMFFVATRDIIVSFLLTVLYVIVVDGILHEKRNFAVLKTTEDIPPTSTNGLKDSNVFTHEGTHNRVKPTSYESYINTIHTLHSMHQ